MATYLNGATYGLPDSCRVHPLANISESATLKCGENCRIDAFVTITGSVTMGDNVHIGAGACLFGSHGIRLGYGVSISPGAKLFTATEDNRSGFVSNPQLNERAYLHGAISVKDYAVIGANAVVLPNVDIGKGAQVGALSLVKQSVPTMEVYAGIPTRSTGLKRNLEYEMIKA